MLNVVNGTGNPFRFEDIGVHPSDQHLLVVGPVENADLPALR
jgi:hypothetical protein